MAGESDAEQSMPEQPFPKTPSVRESDSIDMDDDNSSMDGKEDVLDEDINGIVHDQPVLIDEGGDREDLIKKLYDYCIGTQSQSNHVGPPSE